MDLTALYTKEDDFHIIVLINLNIQQIKSS